MGSFGFDADETLDVATTGAAVCAWLLATLDTSPITRDGDAPLGLDS